MSLKRYANTDAQEETLGLLERLCKANNVPIRYGTSVGKAPQSVVLDLTYQGGQVHVSRNGALTVRDGTKDGLTIPNVDRYWEESEEDVGIDLLDNEPKIADALKRAYAVALAQKTP